VLDLDWTLLTVVHQCDVTPDWCNQALLDLQMLAICLRPQESSAYARDASLCVKLLNKASPRFRTSFRANAAVQALWRGVVDVAKLASNVESIGHQAKELCAEIAAAIRDVETTNTSAVGQAAIADKAVAVVDSHLLARAKGCIHSLEITGANAEDANEEGPMPDFSLSLREALRKLLRIFAVDLFPRAVGAAVAALGQTTGGGRAAEASGSYVWLVTSFGNI
jgi:hypothetical protein